MKNLLSVLLGLFFWGQACALVDVPPLRSRVTDLTGTLNAQQRGALEQTLAEFEARKGAQVAVLIVPTTQPETVEQYAVRVEESWKLGRKGVDDSVLFLVALQDRTMRLEVGYGLEGVLPDAAAKRIIEDDITPRFRQGDFYGGIRAGTDRLMRTIEGEALPSPQGRRHISPEYDIGGWWIALLALLLAGASALKAVFGRLLGGGIAGGIVGAVFYLFFNSLIVGLIAGAFVFLSVLGGIRYGSRGGWTYGGGTWGGGSSGSGGFSGGGGGSGGGGASGSW